jgi:hypothetical protein
MEQTTPRLWSTSGQRFVERAYLVPGTPTTCVTAISKNENNPRNLIISESSNGDD